MSASVTLRSGVVVPVAEAAEHIGPALRAATETGMIELHLDDRGAAGATVLVRANEVALVIDTTPAG